MNRARVAVVGYGVIGRRVADAVRLQDDMEVVGVAGPAGSMSLRDAALARHPVFPVLGDLLQRADVVLDCTPPGTGVDTGGLPTILQGGEKAEAAEVSFNAFANYGAAAGRRRVRVISCSSTGTARFLFVLDRAFGVKDAFVALCRRAADPGKRSRTPINAMLPVAGPSHHAADVRTVLPGLPVRSMSVDVPTTRSHVLEFQVDLRGPADRDAVLEALRSAPRVTVGEGLRSTAELSRDAAARGSRRGDRPEIYVFAEGLRVRGGTVHASVAVHMESITIPETVDCVRSVLRLEEDGWESVRRTDRALR